MTPTLRRKTRTALAVVVLLFAGTTGSGARALGMGGAFIAIADDATASSWNPAGLCVLEKAEASLVVQPRSTYKRVEPLNFNDTTFTDRSADFNSVEVIHEDWSGYSQRAASHALDFASLTVPFRLGALKLVPQISYQRLVDFGLDFDPYGETFTGRDELSETFGGASFVRSGPRSGAYTFSSAQTGGLDVLAASLGVGVTSKVYLGVAVNRWRSGLSGTVDSRDNSNIGLSATAGIPVTFSQSQTLTRTRAIEDAFSGTNVQLGVLLKPSSKLSLGAVFKSAFDMGYTYSLHERREVTVRQASTSGAGTSTLDVRRNVELDIQRNGTIRWPRALGAGIAVMPIDVLTFSFDVTAIQWSAARYDYSETNTTQATVQRTVTPPGNPVTTPSSTTTTFSNAVFWPSYADPDVSESPANPYPEDALQARLGVEYVIRKPGVLGLTVLPLRAGVYRDRQIFKNGEDLSPVYYTGLSGGLGLTWSRLSLDFAYVHLRGAFERGVFGTNTTVVEGATSTEEFAYTYETKSPYRSNRFYLSTTVRF